MKTPAGSSAEDTPLTRFASLGLVGLAALGFHGAFLYSDSFPPAGLLVFAYLGGLWTLRRQSTPRAVFWWGTAVGLACFGPQTAFLWTVFGVPLAGVRVAPLAPVLWLLVALWHGVFLLLARVAEQRFGTPLGWLAAPVLWLGLEYFRAEIWWLRFTWLAVGDCFAGPAGWWRSFGVYGLGAVAWTLVICGRLTRHPERRWRRAGGAGLATVLAALGLTGLTPRNPTANPGRSVAVAGVQWEFPGEPELVRALDRLVAKYPETQLIVLSEYTFDGPPPAGIRRWCRDHARWLVAGGKEPIPTATPTPSDPPAPFRNTAFVIDPAGEIVFTQAKVQPIQFFSDGLPAASQRVWPSPWGPLGIAICYDASYRRVMDRLIRQGARGLLLPTMDVWEWGAHEHTLNSRQAWLRAREYGVPVLRLASSGESLLLDRHGRVTASAPFEEPGTGNFLAGRMELASDSARPPLDHWLAPTALGLIAAWGLVAGIQTVDRGEPARSPPG